jgi:hypothetical protein
MEVSPVLGVCKHMGITIRTDIELCPGECEPIHLPGYRLFALAFWDVWKI